MEEYIEDAELLAVVDDRLKDSELSASISTKITMSDEMCQPSASTSSTAPSTYDDGTSLEGWQKGWEHPPPNAQAMYGPNIPWAKGDGPRGLFQRSASGSKTFKPQMEFHPPPLPTSMKSSIPPMASFFTTKVFFWRPVGVLDLKIRCPNARCTAPPDAYLAKSGFSTIARQVRLMFMYYLFVCVHVCSCVCVILFAWLHDPISISLKIKTYFKYYFITYRSAVLVATTRFSLNGCSATIA